VRLFFCYQPQCNRSLLFLFISRMSLLLAKHSSVIWIAFLAVMGITLSIVKLWRRRWLLLFHSQVCPAAYIIYFVPKSFLTAPFVRDVMVADLLPSLAEENRTHTHEGSKVQISATETKNKHIHLSGYRIMVQTIRSMISSFLLLLRS
jgi:hypothetical protein